MDINWKNIDTVLLDMDGTLLDLHFDSHFWLEHVPQAWASKNQVSLERANAVIFDLMRKHVGTLNWYCVDFWGDALELDIMRLKEDVSHKISYRPSAKVFLERCKQHSNDVRLVTNAHRKVLNLKIEHTQIDQYFDQMLCSHELDCPKEEVAFWQQLQGHKAFDPSRTLFVDDNDAMLDSAHAHGIKHLYSIAEPDSGRRRGSPSKYPMIENFSS